MNISPLSVLLSRLVWFSLLPLLLLASGLAAYHVHSNQVATQESAARRLDNYAAQIDGFLEARILALRMLADSPLADDPKRWPDLYAEAQAFRASFGSQVIFADAERQMLFNTRVPFDTPLPRLPDARQGRSAAPIALETGTPAVGDIVQGPVIDEPLVAIVVPGLRAGRVRHLMLVTSTTREIQRLVNAIPMAPGWVLSVQDSAGDLIARQAPADFDPARDVDADWLFAVKSRWAPWTITVAVPRTVIQEPLLSSIAALLLAIVLTTLAGWLLGRRVACRIARQITALSHTAPDAPLPDISEIAAVREHLDSNLIALRESEERLRLSTELANVAVWEYRFANDSMARSPNHDQLYGLAWQTDWEMSTFLNATHPEDRELSLATIQKSVAPGGPDDYTFDFRVVYPDQSVHWLMVIGQVVERASDGQGTVVRGCLMDITQRKQVQMALNEGNERLAAVMENISEGLVVADRQGLVVYWNPAALAMCGYASMDECRRKIAEFADTFEVRLVNEDRVLPKEDWPLSRVLRGEVLHDWEVRLRRLDRGWEKIVAYSGWLIHSASGESLAFVSSTDVSDRKQAEAELQKFAMLADSSSEFIGMCDLDLNPLYVNPAGVRMVGLPDQAAACRVKVEEYFFPEDQRFIAEEFFPRVLREGHGDVEIRLRHFQTGEPIWMFYYLFSVHDASGAIVGWATVSRDISERKQAEAEVHRLHEELQAHATSLEQRVLERTAELEAAKLRAEAADRVKSTFLATMSHELRTPLNSIIGFTGILLQKLPGPLNAEQEKQLDIVRNASRHLLALISDVLDISKVEAGELHIAHERLDLRALIARLGEVFGPLAARRGLAFGLDITENEAMVIGDRRRLEQVLNNLLSNALKFTPRGCINLSCRKEGDSFVVAVTDTGVGIKTEDMDKLFRPFSQIETGLAGLREGTGLGLAISRSLVEAMGGHISAESEWGQGSCFALTLPCGKKVS
ncbi:MAG: Non-motile and phage-resistance protein [Candidatus Accumulibacter appositus]|uniref:Virulence sensor protein BvgS n=1 Tax=Candidatus Accumulibacter appositus TaxID=1454003 RepID=A0A011PLH0_9PROT|nr:PAS domain S-box protein [Accumulibacter sp.]EXI77862.1 MAG: Non-motile and phage-resistance protein [Candidatus Accumulibacter appositus]HRF05767.1 PAS domain S-box protein [Accumulibacter sp.]